MIDPTVDPGQFLVELFGALVSGKWSLTAVLLTVGLVAGLSWGLGKFVPWFATGDGKRLLSFLAGLVMAAGTAVAQMLSAGGMLSFGGIIAAFGIAFTASGGWAQVKDVLLPLLGKLVASLLRRLGLVPPADSIAKAEAAGDKAVTDQPPVGTSGVVGTPKDVE